MKRILTIPLILSLLLITSCGIIEQANIQDADLDKLLENYNFLPLSTDSFEPETDGKGLPLEILNELKKAVHTGESDEFIRGMNDESLMITADDFVFKPNNSDEIDNGEKSLNDYFMNKNSNFSFYKCDITGDGKDEIIMVENLRYEYSGSNKAYLLKESDGNYVYAGHDYLGYCRCFAIFKYDDKIYLIANFDDYQTGLTKGVGLFELNGADTSGFMWVIKGNHTYIRKTNDAYNYSLLYRNEKTPIVDAVQSYVDSVSVDLPYADRIHNTFYGDETENIDLLEKVRGNDAANNLRLWNIYSIDVDNDGTDNFFCRRMLYNGGIEMKETEVNWYDFDTYSKYTEPFTAWNPAQFYMTQKWFKIIDGKTVIFSLYHKTNEDIYLLDVRMHENGQTTILLNYIITLNPKAEIDDYWDYNSDTNFIVTEYNHIDSVKDPDNITDLIESFALQTQGSFVSVDHKDENIPNDLIALMEKALFNGNIDSLDLGSASFEVDIDDFYNKYGQQQKDKGYFALYDSISEFSRYVVRHIYRYNLNGDTYYLLVVDSGGSARIVNISLYKEADGALISSDYLDSFDFNARVIKYNNVLYLINKSYNFYSKYTDTVLIYRLLPDKIGDYVTIELVPEKYQWKNIDNNGQYYEAAITDYVNSIKEDLMNKSPIDDNIEIYTGDETKEFDHDKLLRLKSVGGKYDYYEIDFNNDGATEYIEKRFWFPSNYTTLHLINNTYKFTDRRIVSTNGGFSEKEITLVQLWFKEIEGKTFTFRLFLTYGYNYLLNVALIENTDVTQVQNYIIAPESELIITSRQRSLDPKM